MDRRSNERIPVIEIYTDGSCKKAGKYMTFGGWAYYALADNELINFNSGGEDNTTNQRMELKAVIEALKYAKSIRRGSERVIIYSDSAYVVNCYLKEWYVSWERNNWLNSKREGVANRDLWEQIIPFFDNFWYSFQHVKGHNQIFWNEKCDDLAQKEAELLKHKWRGQEDDK